MIDALYRLGYRTAFTCLKIWWLLRRTPAEGACILVWQERKLLVVRQSYRKGLALPGGGLRSGETPKAAALRELREEVGLTCDPKSLRPLTSCALIEDGRPVTTHLFSLDLRGRPTLKIDHREIVAADFLSAQELADRPLTPVLTFCLSQPVDDRLSGTATKKPVFATQ